MPPSKPDGIRRVPGVQADSRFSMNLPGPWFWTVLILATAPLMAVKIPGLGVGLQNLTLPVGGLALVLVLRRDLGLRWPELRTLTLALVSTYLWIGISAAMGSFPSLSLRSWVKLGEYGFVFAGFVALCSRRERLARAMRLALAALVILACLGTLEALVPDNAILVMVRSDASLSIYPRVASVLLWPNQYGVAMIVGGILSYSLRHRGRLSVPSYWASQLLFLAQLAQSGSRNAWITAVGTLMVGTILGAFPWRRALVALGLFVVVLLVLPVSAYQLGLGQSDVLPIAHDLLEENYRNSPSLSPMGESASLRSKLWTVAFGVVRHTPVFGMGLGGFAVSGGPLVMGRSGFNTHSLALELAVGAGLVGLGLAVWSLVELAKVRDRRHRFAGIALLAILGGQLVDCFLYDPAFMVLFAFVGAFFVSPGSHSLPLGDR